MKDLVGFFQVAGIVTLPVFVGLMLIFELEQPLLSKPLWGATALVFFWVCIGMKIAHGVGKAETLERLGIREN